MKKQHATLGQEVSNAKNCADTKRLIATMNLVVNTKRGLISPVFARWYRGRANTATNMYCSVWIHGRNFCTTGAGVADGGGYCKISGSFDTALRSANIQLKRSVHGVGEGAVREAMQAIAKALGYRGQTIIVEN